jgi:hypothetical protein
MESVAAWCAERGLAIEPYGVDISPALAELARRRLPQWADRIWVGNAVNWRPPGGMRFDYVHILLDCVPRARRGRPGPVPPGSYPFGRVRAACWSATTPPITAAGHQAAAETLTALGFRLCGPDQRGRPPRRPLAPTAWITAP